MRRITNRTAWTIRKRAAVWTAGVLALLAWYVLAAPIIVYPIERWFPGATPILKVVYAPLIYVSDNSDGPGHHAFLRYADWCYDSLNDAF